MAGKRLFTVFLGTLLMGVSAHAAEDELRTMIRAGCPDEKNCCFGHWQVATAGDVFETESFTDKSGTVLPGTEVETVAGRVHTEPGKLKVLFNHGEWKAGQTIGLYSTLDSRGYAQIGTTPYLLKEEVKFLGAKDSCKVPSKTCWGTAVSLPKQKWWVKIKLSPDRTGWVEASHLVPNSDCE